MGQRITQRIYTCDLCGKTPDDGEFMTWNRKHPRTRKKK